MVKLKITRVAAAAAASIGLVAGFSGIVGASPDGHHHDMGGTVVLTNTKTISKNNVSVSNNVDQNATSGDVMSTTPSSHDKHGDDEGDMGSSTTGGSATTDPATNTSSFSVDGTVKNNPPAPVVVTPSTTSDDGGGAFVKTDTKTVSVNNVSVSNNVDQNATSGDATVKGGSDSSATTGKASNSSSVSVTLDVQN